MKVEICVDPLRWDAYVASVPEASNYHRWGWKTAVEETFAHTSYYLAAVSDEDFKGVLPLVEMKSRLFGHFLVSIPFFSYGGVLASNTEARDALLARAVDLAHEVGASHIELRQATPQTIDWCDTTAKVAMEVSLPNSVEALWNALSSGIRNKVRNARRNRWRIEWGGANSVETFHKTFSTNMRNLGTPVYPQRWFWNLCKQFPEEVKILTLWDNDEAVASGLITCYRNSLELPWSATLPESRKKYSAVFLYWTLLEWAISNGYRRVDFGRCTKGSGVYEFKRHWNSCERPLHWYYWLASGSVVPEFRPDSPRYRMATHLWRHLPLKVANLLGPRIVRSIP